MKPPAVDDRLLPLFSPESVAHVGASESGMYPAGIYTSLRASRARVYAVNPGRRTVFGDPSYPDLESLPEVPELVVVTIPADRVPDLVARAAEAGTRAAIVISSGFAEAGAPGRRLQERLATLAKDIVILGPNCAGCADLESGFVAARLSAPVLRGGISLVSQSGALMMALHGSFAGRGAGMRRLVSVGNQAGITVEDMLLSCARDPGTRTAAAFMEGVGDGAAFVRALEALMDAGKPLVILKSGTTTLGANLAASHTAAAAVDGAVFESVCARYRAILVRDTDEFVDTVRMVDLFAGTARASGRGGDAEHVDPVRRIAWLSQSGGLGSLTGDLTERSGLRPPRFRPELAARLVELGLAPDTAAVQNPLDMRGDAMRGAAIRSSLEPFVQDPGTGAIGVLFAKNPLREVEAETASELAAISESCGKPLFCVWVGELPATPGTVSASTLLAGRRVQVFSGPARAVGALAGYARWISGRRQTLPPEEARSPSGEHRPSGEPVHRAEGGAARLLPLSWTAAARMLGNAGIRTPESVLAADPDAAGRAAERIGDRIALKLVAAEYTHKSDSGLVALDLRGGTETAAAARRMAARVPPGTAVEGFLVQPMVGTRSELFLGAIRDPVFGPLAAFGPGGIHVDGQGGVDFLRWPFDEPEALTFVDRNRARPLVDGERGRTPFDRAALASALAALAGLVASGAAAQVDLNPVMADPDGIPLAVDYPATVANPEDASARSDTASGASALPGGKA